MIEHVLIPVPNWDTKLRCVCDAEFNTKQEAQAHVVAAKDTLVSEILASKDATISDLWGIIEKLQTILAAKEEMIDSLCSGRSSLLGLGSQEPGSASSTGGDGS